MTLSTVLEADKTLPVKPMASPASVLQKVVTKKNTGHLTSWDPNIASAYWRVYVGKGQVHKERSRFLLLSLALSQNLCLYEVATQLKISVLELATLLQPLVKVGAISIHSYILPSADERSLIVCVDDTKTVQCHANFTLEAAGYRVLGFLEPAHALTELVQHEPALILMDICMPKVDGYEVCRLLRQSPLLRDIPIVILTGRDRLIDQFRARMVGANEYITKPFHLKQLLIIVRKQLSTTGRGVNEKGVV